MSKQEKLKIIIQTDEFKQELEGECLFGSMIADEEIGTSIESFLVGNRAPEKLGVDMAKTIQKLLLVLPREATEAYLIEMIIWAGTRTQQMTKDHEKEAEAEKEDIDIFGEVLGNAPF